MYKLRRPCPFTSRPLAGDDTMGTTDGRTWKDGPISPHNNRPEGATYVQAAWPYYQKQEAMKIENDAQDWCQAEDFDRGFLSKEDKEDNPYDHKFDKEASMHMLNEDLREHLAHLPQVPEKPWPGMTYKTLVVDKTIVASRLLHLQNRGVILCTVDFNPSKDYFQDWSFSVVGQRMQIEIEQIKVLSRSTFLIVMSNHEEQKSILLEP